MNEPGADNTACDGLSPTNRGGGHCPFKDFLSDRTQRLLRDAAGVRVEVRAGTYTFAGDGLVMSGRGGSDSTRNVLTAYQNEPVVFDGQNIIRELVQLQGQYTTVERLTFQNAGAYNVEVLEGHHHVVQCNRFLANRASDSLKGTPGAGTTVIRENEFTQWDSQAIDMTGVRDWTIERNEFHDPRAFDGNAIGAKLGTQDVRIAQNHFRNTRGLGFGGVGGVGHPHDYEAFNLVAEDNTFTDIPNVLVKFYSCADCVFRRNTARGVGGGMLLGGVPFEGPSPCSSGCRPTRGALVVENRLADLRGGAEGDPNTFWWVFSSESTGLTARDNLYCTSSGQSANFFFDGHRLPFADWTRTIRTDSSSIVASASDARCNGW
jgi:hypothetical protein